MKKKATKTIYGAQLEGHLLKARNARLKTL